MKHRFARYAVKLNLSSIKIYWDIGDKLFCAAIFFVFRDFRGSNSFDLFVIVFCTYAIVNEKNHETFCVLRGSKFFLQIYPY